MFRRSVRHNSALPLHAAAISALSLVRTFGCRTRRKLCKRLGAEKVKHYATSGVHSQCPREKASRNVSSCSQNVNYLTLNAVRSGVFWARESKKTYFCPSSSCASRERLRSMTWSAKRWTLSQASWNFFPPMSQ